MMTARAEYRLSLRADNATTRLGEAALDAGCVSGAGVGKSRIKWRRGECSSDGNRGGRADALYRPYVERQQREWEVVQRDSRVWFPRRSTMRAIPGLSNEMVERLARRGPRRWTRLPECLASRLPRYRRSMWRRAAAPRRDSSVSAVARRDVSRETFDRLEPTSALLREEKAHQNLVSAATLEQVWERHILDSAQLVHVRAATWRDVDRHRIGRGPSRNRHRLPCDGPVTWSSRDGFARNFSTSVVESLESARERRSVPRPSASREVRRDHGARGRAAYAIARDIRTSVHKKHRLGASQGARRRAELAEARPGVAR